MAARVRSVITSLLRGCPRLVNIRQPPEKETALESDGSPQSDEVTQLLAQWRQGSPEAEARLIAVVQSELRKLAASYLRRERHDHTLQPTAIVNEAYLRLVPQRHVQWENRAHFFGIAARMMRRILVDHARRKRAAKREGFVGDPVSLSHVADPAGGHDVDVVDVLDLHDALSELAAIDARQAEIVELRYFGGLKIEEIGVAVGVSASTVKRELTTATAWLRHRLRTLGPGSDDKGGASAP